MDILIVDHAKAVAADVFFDVCGGHLQEESRWYLEPLNVGPDLTVFDGRQKLVVMAHQKRDVVAI